MARGGEVRPFDRARLDALYLPPTLSAVFHVKIYIVQKPDGELLAAKLTRATAQAVAKRHAPAKVTMVVADKEEPAPGRTNEPAPASSAEAAPAVPGLAAATSHRRPAA